MLATKSRKISLKNVVILLAAALIACWLILLAGINAFVWYEVRDMAHQQPDLSITPIPLSDNRLADLSIGQIISANQYDFRVPWLKLTARRDFNSITALSFEDHISVLASDTGFMPDTLSLWRIRGDKNLNLMRKTLGENAIRSNYDLTAAAMQSTPSKASLFYSKARNVGILTLVELKGLTLLSETNETIHPIAFGNWKGFEVSGDDKVQHRVRLVLFNREDQHIELLLKVPSATADTELSQPIINAIVASIHFKGSPDASPAQPAANVPPT